MTALGGGVLASTLLDVHTSFAWVVVVANGVAGLWALAAAGLERLRHRVLWWFTAAAQVTVFAQVILGVAVMQADDIEAPELHVFYGFIAIIAVAILYAYRTQMWDRLYLLYGGGGLFVMGLVLRASFI